MAIYIVKEGELKKIALLNNFAQYLLYLTLQTALASLSRTKSTILFDFQLDFDVLLMRELKVEECLYRISAYIHYRVYLREFRTGQ